MKKEKKRLLDEQSQHMKGAEISLGDKGVTE